ncbi:hypothetical protein ACVOMS_01465 [Bradyrhizobium guangxiense]
MWLFFLVAWFVLLAAIAFLAQQALGYDIAHLPAWFAGLPTPQRIIAGAVLAGTLALIGATAWRLSRQERSLKTLRDRLRKTREDVVVAHALQNHLDATVQHLIESDPREAVSALHDKLGETEQRALLQQGRNESTDMHDQLDEIRRRQQALREMVGKVADQRRAVEPVFTEIRDRQNQLERSLHDLETDDRKNNLADRQRDIARDVAALLGRVNAVQETFAALNQYREDLAKSHAEARAAALIGGRHQRPDRRGSASVTTVLPRASTRLETGGEAPLSNRVETLSKNKIEIEQRLAGIDDSFNILKSVRLDFEEARPAPGPARTRARRGRDRRGGQDSHRAPERAERICPPVAPASWRAAGDPDDAERFQSRGSRSRRPTSSRSRPRCSASKR